MRWREALQPVGMERVALLAPSDGLRDLLVNVADEGTVALGEAPAENGTAATSENEPECAKEFSGRFSSQ
jgi:V/A-type H+-transporting ATPase subunit I